MASDAPVYTRFTDGGNRSNDTASYAFRRQLERAPVKPVPSLAPITSLPEDSLSFNPVTTTSKEVDGRWTIVDGNHLLFSFGGKKAEALNALKVIPLYRLDPSCFVGRPHLSEEVSGPPVRGGRSTDEGLANSMDAKKLK